MNKTTWTHTHMMSSVSVVEFWLAVSNYTVAAVAAALFKYILIHRAVKTFRSRRVVSTKVILADLVELVNSLRLTRMILYNRVVRM
mmetsp:Transcript_143926/g.358827  ORF Transcript_143926/g.358827 Transcript_143926/m.358827 type:complete len:86 (+) Transcript_143926:582-839(+)